MGVIFDLDQTLIDTSIADAYRTNRQWNQVYGLIPKFSLYPKVIETLQFLHENNIPVCIVTSSPSTYCERVLKHWDIKVINRVCFHDTKLRKPHPEPILRALSIIRCNPGTTLSLGDRDIDVLASNNAKVISVACLWGASDPAALDRAQPAHTLKDPQEMINFFAAHFGL